MLRAQKEGFWYLKKNKRKKKSLISFYQNQGLILRPFQNLQIFVTLKILITHLQM